MYASEVGSARVGVDAYMADWDPGVGGYVSDVSSSMTYGLSDVTATVPV